MATPHRPHHRSHQAILARHRGKVHGKHGLEPLTSEQLAERIGVDCYHAEYLTAHKGAYMETCKVCGAKFEEEGYTIGCPGCLDHEHAEE